MMLASRSHSSSSSSSHGTPKASRKKAAAAAASCTKNCNGGKKTKKSVRFQKDQDLVTVHPITPRSQFTRQFIQQGWYNFEDYHMISQENNHILKCMMIGGEGIKHVETSESTTRGLESKTLEGAEHKKISILDGLCAVLLEQERQRQKDVVDEERIREAYLLYTQVPAMAALKQGKLDSRVESDCFGKFKKEKCFDMQSTDTTLISDESATNAESLISGENDYMIDGGEVKSRSIVKRLLKGRIFTKQRRKASSAAYKLCV
jgi:hypothetical protein